ncbi:MAG TPA: GNAT family N-acetyltransferase, partial [Gemmata sp.]|nr:GNAT family N-acetyltransferase [Gemmata sp.]
MNLTLRRAAVSDLEVLVAFNAALAWETEHKRLRPSVLNAGVRAVLADPAKGFYTVAENDRGEVVGQMMVTFEWSDWRNGWFWWVQSVYVRDDARRGGVFRALYREVQRQAA